VRRTGGSGSIQELLRRAGLRATSSRVAVIKRLRAADRPVTHGDLAHAMVPQGYDRASIFRNLTDLTAAGLVSRADLGDHVWRFSIGEDTTHHARHPHFVCIDCGGVQCLDAAQVSVTPVRVRERKALLQKNLEIILRGRCEECCPSPRPHGGRPSRRNRTR